jgi:hypothetical protein
MARIPKVSKPDASVTETAALKRVLPDYVENFDGVMFAEYSGIAERRAHLLRGGGDLMKGIAPVTETDEPAFTENMEKEDGETYSVSGVKDTVGVSLSGGGIRSAAFCTGAMQALAKNKILSKIDYLSCVSGGGYCGISTVLALNKFAGVYPFFKVDEKKDTADTGVLRDNVNYLRMGEPRAMLKNFAIVIKGLVTNLLLVASVLLFLAAFTLFAKPLISDLCSPGFHFMGSDVPLECVTLTGYKVSLIALGLFLFLVVMWAVWGSVKQQFENFKGSFVNISGGCLLGVALIFFCDFQPHLIRKMIPDRYFGIVHETTNCAAENVNNACVCCTARELDKSPKADISSDTTGWNRLIGWLQTIVAPLIALIALASKQLGDLFKTNEQETGFSVLIKKAMGKLVVWAVALALPVVMWACYLGLVYWGIGTVSSEQVMSYPFAPNWLLSAMKPFASKESVVYGFSLFYLLLSVVLFLVWLLTVLEPNANSLFGLYRARLNDSFCVPWSARSVTLSDLKISKLDAKYAPVLLVNAALNVQASPKVNRRGRNADFFTFSPFYVGSKATGYIRTSVYEGEEKQIDLASAMAISGAAVSSNMGSQSMQPLRPTLALLNARLGAWLLNPKKFTLKVEDKPKRTPLFYLAELCGLLDEKKRSIYLTDGGHVENLGIYELLKRRCKIIIAVDAEADRDMNFSSLVTLQRYARIDLGTRIKLPRSKIASRSKDAQKPDGKSEMGPHCAIGKIEYGENENGILVYVKASVTGDENDYIKDYNRRFRDYPHETTGDQFFSEEQFEVYRALGFHAVDEMLSGNDFVQTTGDDLEKLSSETPQGHGVGEFAEWVDSDALRKAKHLAPGA